MKNIIGFLYNSMKIDEETIDYMYLNYANNNSEVMRNNLTQLVTNKFGRKYVQPYWAIVDNMKNVKNITWGNFLTGDYKFFNSILALFADNFYLTVAPFFVFKRQESVFRDSARR